ncbi:MAG: phosphopantetheine-binding protein [Actinomycetota bacterium]
MLHLDPNAASTSAKPGSDVDLTRSVLILLDLELGVTGIGLDTQLLADGHLDSLGVLDLVLLLETTFGLTLDEDTLSVDDFATVPAIVDLVRSSLGESIQ